MHSPKQISTKQIAGILRQMNPAEPSLRVSYETIYTALYAMPRGELRTELIGLLTRALARAADTTRSSSSHR